MPSALIEVLDERFERAARDGGDTLLVALSHDAQKAFLEYAIRDVEPRAFAHAQTAAIQHFQNGTIAQLSRRIADGLVEEPCHLIDAQHVGQLFGSSRQAHGRCRIVLGVTFAHAEAVKALQHRDVPIDAGHGITAFGKVGFVAHDCIAVDAIDVHDVAFL